MTDISIVIDADKEIAANTEWEIWDGNGWRDFAAIKKSTHSKVIKFYLSNGYSITTTLMHEFVLPNGTTARAKDIAIGDTIGDNVTVISKDYLRKDTDVFDVLSVGVTNAYMTNGIISHNCAFIPTIEDIWTSAFPTLSRGGSAILISTPNGVGNFFYRTWVGASDEVPKEDRNLFNRIFCHWTQVPEQRGFDPVPDGWTFEQIVEEAKKHKWYQENRPQFDNRRWAQEFEGDFLGSGHTVVDQDVIKATEKAASDPKFKYDEFFNQTDFGDFWLWKEPQEGIQYVIGADVASGDGSDYSAFQILEALTGEQVAEYRGKINILDYARFLAEVGEMYNYALVIPELTGMGIGVVQKLILEIGYPNVYKLKNEQTMKENKSVYGWNTSSKTRPLLVQAIIHYAKDCEWHSKRLWRELSTFVWKSNGKAEADKGNNDDLVMALGMAAHNRETAMGLAPVPIVGGDKRKVLPSTDWQDVIIPDAQDNEEDIKWLFD